MKYLDEINERDIDKKKVVGARVSEDVLAALNIASAEMHLYGYNFSITKVIEKALDNTLSEINERTHLDYYKLVKFERKIKDIDDDPTFPFSKEIITAEPSQYSEDLKHEFLSQFEFKEEQKDFDSFLENWEKDLLKQWNKILKPHDIEISNKGNEYIMIGSDGKSKFVL